MPLSSPHRLPLLFVYLSFCLIALLSCGKAAHKEQPVVAEQFSADSAYRFIAEQVAFGSRVPGSMAHEECCRYLQQTLQRFGAEVEQQTGTMTNYAGEDQTVVNIIGRFNPSAKRRVLLCAHWDCRPWADQEDEYSARMTPVSGANDGASGVGVLLEVARQLSNKRASGEKTEGIDIVFFDVEDKGTPDFYTGKQREDTWCLGSQMWALQYKQARKSNPSAPKYRYGILLDMVASPDAVFPREYFSDRYASSHLDRVWETAANLGYGRFFVSTASYPVTDDHYYVNTIAGVPCIDIIHYDVRSNTGFPYYWHTTHDDMTNVSTTTLDAVGKTVLTALLH